MPLVLVSMDRLAWSRRYPLRPLCRRYSGIRRKWQSVRWLSRRRGGRHREKENSNQAEDGTRGGHLKYLRERMAKEIRGKISETFRSGHQAGLRASAPASTSAASLQVVKKISHSFWLMDLRAVDGSIFVGAVACWHIASQGETEMVEIGSPIYSSAWHLNLS